MSADITVRRGDIDCDTHTVELGLTPSTVTLTPSEAADLAGVLVEVAAPPPLCQRPAGTLRGPYGRAEACEHYAVRADDSCRCHGGGGGL